MIDAAIAKLGFLIDEFGFKATSSQIWQVIFESQATRVDVTLDRIRVDLFVESGEKDPDERCRLWIGSLARYAGVPFDLSYAPDPANPATLAYLNDESSQLQYLSDILRRSAQNLLRGDWGNRHDLVLAEVRYQMEYWLALIGKKGSLHTNLETACVGFVHWHWKRVNTERRAATTEVLAEWSRSQNPDEVQAARSILNETRKSDKGLAR